MIMPLVPLQRIAIVYGAASVALIAAYPMPPRQHCVQASQGSVRKWVDLMLVLPLWRAWLGAAVLFGTFGAVTMLMPVPGCK